jgi:hypothetical protein
MVEIQPASFLQLWAIYEVIGDFDAFNSLQSYPSVAVANYTDAEIERRGDLENGDPQRTTRRAARGS